MKIKHDYISDGYLDYVKEKYGVDIDYFTDLFEQGLSQKAIAKELNITRKIVRRIASVLGLNWNERDIVIPINVDTQVKSEPIQSIITTTTQLLFTQSTPNTPSKNNKTKIRKETKPIIKKVIKRIGFITDVHLGHHDEDAILIAVDYLRDKDLDILILGGDIMDCDSISFWKSLNKYSLKEELDMAKDFLSWIRFNFPQPEMYYLESNHALRIQKHLLSNAKEFAYLDELKIPNLLKLDNFNITYISNTELLQKYRKPFKIGNIVFLHGHEVKMSWGAINIARTMYLKTQDNVVFGHFHTTQEYMFRNISNEIRGAWSVGALCDLSPNYSPVNNWNHGFAYIEIYSNGDFAVHNKKIINGAIY